MLNFVQIVVKVEIIEAEVVNEETQAIRGTKFCENCGKEIDYNAVICPECGV